MVLTLIAWGLADVTHDISWGVLVILITWQLMRQVDARNEATAAWNRRAAADSAAGISGAPTPAYSRQHPDDTAHESGLAVPTVTGGVHFFSDTGAAHQFPPVEIVEIDRSLPYDRIRITTTDKLRPEIVIYPQGWNVVAWAHLTTRDAWDADQGQPEA
ncbi:hypothetical protein PV364_36975 [Streptomyces sp. MI02-7b]|nr:hypothetical protein [Streptomyces sp. MI02-7b]